MGLSSVLTILHLNILNKRPKKNQTNIDLILMFFCMYFASFVSPRHRETV